MTGVVRQEMTFWGTPQKTWSKERRMRGDSADVSPKIGVVSWFSRLVQMVTEGTMIRNTMDWTVVVNLKWLREDEVYWKRGTEGLVIREPRGGWSVQWETNRPRSGIETLRPVEDPDRSLGQRYPRVVYPPESTTVGLKVEIDGTIIEVTWRRDLRYGESNNRSLVEVNLLVTLTHIGLGDQRWGLDDVIERVVIYRFGFGLGNKETESVE